MLLYIGVFQSLGHRCFFSELTAIRGKFLKRRHGCAGEDKEEGTEEEEVI